MDENFREFKIGKGTHAATFSFIQRVSLAEVCTSIYLLRNSTVFPLQKLV